MNERPVDYDKVAATYGARYATGLGEGQHTIPPALRQLLRHDGGNHILEVGCGTGLWLGSFHNNDEVYGLDLSPAMLRIAKEHYANLICGTAERLPFPSRMFDLIYCVNAFHHFIEKATFIHEAARLLRSDGMLAIFGMDPHNHRPNWYIWYIYDYFEGTYETDLRRFPPIPQTVAWMREAGFTDMRDCVVERILNHQYGRAVLNHSVLQKNGTSELILLSDEAYATGLSHLKRDLAEGEVRGEVLTFSEDIPGVLVTGRLATIER